MKLWHKEWMVSGPLRKISLERSRRISQTLRILIGLMAGVLLLHGTGRAVEANSPTEAVKATIEEAIHVLSDETIKHPERAQERREVLEKIVGQRFSYEEMAKRTLGMHWRKLSQAEKTEFVTLFQRFLSNSYAGKIDGYAGEQVQYLGERIKGNFAEVRTKVVSDKLEIPLDYRLLKNSDNWRVYDVIVDGISLVKNYRGQFARIIKSSSYKGLIEKLRSKVE